MLRQVRDRVLDQAEESLRISLAAYQEGATDLLRLLDAQRSRNETRLLQTQAEMSYRIGLVELEAAVGEENLSVTEELFVIPSKRSAGLWTLELVAGPIGRWLLPPPRDERPRPRPRKTEPGLVVLDPVVLQRVASCWKKSKRSACPKCCA